MKETLLPHKAFVSPSPAPPPPPPPRLGCERFLEMVSSQPAACCVLTQWGQLQNSNNVSIKCSE